MNTRHAMLAVTSLLAACDKKPESDPAQVLVGRRSGRRREEAVLGLSRGPDASEGDRQAGARLVDFPELGRAAGDKREALAHGGSLGQSAHGDNRAAGAASRALPSPGAVSSVSPRSVVR